MNPPLQVLIVEDCDADAMLLLHELKRGGFNLRHEQVSTREKLGEALARGPWDIVFSDYAMPSFDGMSALSMVKESGLDVPFILVSGTVGEERAVAAMKAGATDYLMKGNLARLAPTVERELRDARERRQQRQVAEAWRQSEERFAKLFEACPAAVLVSTLPEGVILEANAMFQKVFGFTRDELIGRTTREIAIWGTPGERTRFLQELESQGRVANFETGLRTRAGAVGHFLVTSEAVEMNGAKCVLSLLFDLTEKKRAEAQALRSQRLESIGTLAAGISHDLNNALAPILMSIDLLRTGQESPEESAILDTLAASTKRAANMVSHVLTFTRGLGGEHIAVPLGHLLKEVHGILRQTLPKNIQLKTTFMKGLWMAPGDATQLHQVLMNLCVNARDAMPNGGNLTVWAENVTLDEQYQRMSAGAGTGPHVRVTVTDTGTGMSKELLDQIFEPFFTTKPVGQGTGLGLPSVKEIVKKHGGFLTVRSAVGQGTEFAIFLPASPELGAGPVTADPARLPLGNGELVLLVDDESSICDITSQTLRMHNYEVVTARDGARALSVFAQNRDQIRLLLTDLNMPILDGMALIRSVRELAPSLRIIVSSSPRDASQMDPGQLGVRAFLQKPYTAQQLLTTIREVLDND